MPDREQIFEQWLAGKLTTEQRQQAEVELAKEPVFKARMETARSMQHMADMATNEPAPEWDRGGAFEENHQPWWQWQGFPALSMAFSCAAIMLVLLRVELTMTNDGMLLSFAGSKNNSEKLVELVDERLNDFALQQQVTLANFNADIVAQQQQSNLQLASYILETSRQERKEDISDFVSYIGQQRKDDQLQQRIQYQQLEDAVMLQSQYFSNQNATMQKANWVAEE